MWTFIKGEPVILLALVEATIALVVAFGLDLTMEQTAAILGVTAIVVSIVTRQLVTPMATLGKAPPKRAVKSLIVMLALLSLTSCASLLPYLTRAAQFAQYVDAIVTQVEPLLSTLPDDKQARATQALARVRASLRALDRATLAAQADADGDVERQRDELLAAYEELRRALAGTPLVDALGAGGEPLLPETRELEALAR